MLLRIVAIFLLSTICSTAMGFTSRTESQIKDVALHDGRHIKVESTVQWTTQFKILDPFFGLPIMPRFEKSGPDTFNLKFKHPDTQETITWQGEQYYTPVLLDIVSSVPYLVVNGVISKKTEAIYGCPELPYFYLKYESGFFGKWLPVPVEKAPDVLRISNLSQASRNDGGFLQRVIPRTYEEWNYMYKNSHRNERKVWDCRPPRQVPAKVVLPTPQEVSLEILETRNYSLDRIINLDDWTRLAFDKERDTYCSSLFKQADPDDSLLGERFTKDETGQKNVPYGKFDMRTGVKRLCDKDNIFFIAHLEEPGKMVVTKYTPNGDLQYRISFQNPEEVKGFVGYIMAPTIKSEGGYLYFEWWHFMDSNMQWHVKRSLKARFREPAHEASASTPLIVTPTSSTGGSLEGTWTIDSKATENFVKSSSPPSFGVTWLAKWFKSSAKSLALRTYKFDGDTISASAYGVDNKIEFQLTSQRGTEKRYSPTTISNGSVNSLTVSLLKDGNIIIVPSGEPEMAYVLWKREASKKEQSIPDDLMTAWVASIRSIILFLFELPKESLEPSSPIKKASPQPNFEAAIRNGTIRRATTDDARAWLNADIEKYKRKNLSPPDDLDEAYILGHRIYGANAYVVLKKFTYPPELSDINVPIFMIPRDIPAPDGDYGHSKIYHFYEDYFEGPSVEYSLGSPWAKDSGFIIQ